MLTIDVTAEESNTTATTTAYACGCTAVANGYFKVNCADFCVPVAAGNNKSSGADKSVSVCDNTSAANAATTAAVTDGITTVGSNGTFNATSKFANKLNATLQTTAVVSDTDGSVIPPVVESTATTVITPSHINLIPSTHSTHSPNNFNNVHTPTNKKYENNLLTDIKADIEIAFAAHKPTLRRVLIGYLKTNPAMFRNEDTSNMTNERMVFIANKTIDGKYDALGFVLCLCI